MKKATYILSVIVLVFVSCHAQKAEPTKFSEAALNDQFISYEGGEEITLSNILKQYKGKTIVIDVWASWCGDCLKGLPKVKALQATYSEVEYVFFDFQSGRRLCRRSALPALSRSGAGLSSEAGHARPFARRERRRRREPDRCGSGQTHARC